MSTCPIPNCSNEGSPLCLAHYSRVPVGLQRTLLNARNNLQRAQNVAQRRIRRAAYESAVSAAVAAVRSKEPA